MSGQDLDVQAKKDFVVDYVELLIQGGMPTAKAFEETAKHFHVTPDSVRNKYYRQRTLITKTHGNQLLTDEQELFLSIVLSVLSSHHLPANVSTLPKIVKSMFGVHFSEATAKNFIARHNHDLSIRKSKVLTKSRKEEVILDDCTTFIAELEAARRRFPLKKENVINYDETRVYAKLGEGAAVESRQRTSSNRAGPNGKSIGTLVQFITASGLCLMSVWIFYGKKNEKTDLMNVSVPLPKDLPCDYLQPMTYFAATPSSYSNGDLHKNIMQTFFNFWKKMHPNDHCYVFGDQLSFHSNIDVLTEGLKDNIFVWSLPKNTSHFLQPLDNICFANFKKEIRTIGKEYDFPGMLKDKEGIQELYSTAYEASKTAFTPRVIKRSFRNTGIFPFDPEKIMANARQNLGEFKKATEITKKKATEMMVNVVTEVLSPKKPTFATPPARLTIRMGSVHDPHAILECFHEEDLREEGLEEPPNRVPRLGDAPDELVRLPCM